MVGPVTSTFAAVHWIVMLCPATNVPTLGLVIAKVGPAMTIDVPRCEYTAVLVEKSYMYPLR